MDLIVNLFSGQGTATTLLQISVTALLGVLLGRLEIRNVKLGIAGVLFSGLLIAHLGARPQVEVLNFIREFGLILFVYAIGIDVGPRFFSTFKDDGLKQNLIAAGIVISGFVIAYAVACFSGVRPTVVAGIMSGAVTNTPGLGAAQQVLIEQGTPAQDVATTAMGYAVAYPFGILGIILTMILIRRFFKIRVDREVTEYNERYQDGQQKLESVTITVTNPNLFGQKIGYLKKIMDPDLVISRLCRGDNCFVASDSQILQAGDKIYGVSQLGHIENLRFKMGEVEITGRAEITGDLAMEHVLVTNRGITGKTIDQIGISRRYEANITRLFRAGMEILPTPGTTVELGDTVRIVGKRTILPDVRTELGNSVKELSIPNTIPIFIGIFLGVILGSLPISIPGMPAPAKLGLAGGPLLVAILIGHMGRIGKLDFYMTPGATMMLREIGITLFLACVGLLSGGQFVVTILNGGYAWMLYGAVITVVPILLFSILARFWGFNYLKICGILAGAMTDPPALEFANAIAPVQAQSTSYATVYPLTMFLRIFLAQLLVLLTI